MISVQFVCELLLKRFDSGDVESSNTPEHMNTVSGRMQQVRRRRQIRSIRQLCEHLRAILVCLEKHVPHGRHSIASAGTSIGSDGIDADVDIPAACVARAQPSQEPPARNLLDRDHALACLIGRVRLEEYRDPVLRCIACTKKPKRRGRLYKRHRDQPPLFVS